jgi:glycosyltransferase involved in cell wall biosynthesis
VTVGGYLDDQSRDKILAEAALVVYPSFYEGFGFPPLEALQRNIPVLTSFGGSLGEILKDNGLIFDPLDYKTMGINIWQILEIKNWQPKNSFDHDLAQFDWKKSAQSFRELLVS